MLTQLLMFVFDLKSNVAGYESSPVFVVGRLRLEARLIMDQSHKRIFFTKEDDMALAREVAGQNPFEDPSRWSIIQINLLQIIGKYITVRTVKDRLRNMIKKFVENDKKLVYKSGTEEEVDELNDLLRYISELMDALKNKAVAVKNKKCHIGNSYQKGFILRENATAVTSNHNVLNVSSEVDGTIHNFMDNEIEIIEDQNASKEIQLVGQTGTDQATNEPSIKNDTSKKRTSSQRNILTPTRKRTGGLKPTTLNYLQKKNDRWFEIRSRELELEERQKVLDEKRFELECLERQKKLKTEEQKEEMHMQLLRNQQRLMEAILSKTGAESLL